MALEVSGKIFKILNLETGEGKNGQWKKRTFVIETEEQYPKKVALDCWGDLAEIVQSSYSVGDRVTAGINFESRDFKDKWYTSIKAWKLNKTGVEIPKTLKPDAPVEVKKPEINQEVTNQIPAEFANQLPVPPVEDDLPF